MRLEELEGTFNGISVSNWKQQFNAHCFSRPSISISEKLLFSTVRLIICRFSAIIVSTWSTNILTCFSVATLL